MADATLGTYWIQISPSMRGISKGIQAELGNVNVNKATSGWKSSVTGAFSGAFSTVKSMAATTFAAVGAVIATHMGSAVKRADALNAFPTMMKNLGYTTEDASKSMSKMVKSLDGLPTTLDSMTGMVTQLAPLTGGLDKATDISLAFNNALLAGGKSTALQTNAMEQYSQMLSVGKVDMAAWRSMVTAMPGQMNQLSASLLGTGSNAMDLYAAMKDGTVSFDDFNQAVVNLNENGIDGFASFSEQAKGATQGIGTAFENTSSRINNALAKIISALGVNDISGLINNMSSGIVGVGSDIADFVTKVKGSPEAMEKFKSVLGGIGPIFGAMAGSLGPVLKDVPLIGQLFKGVTGPAGLVVGTFVQIVTNSQSLREALGNLGRVLMNVFQKLLPIVGTIMAAIGVALGTVGDALAPIVNLAAGIIQLIMDHLGVFASLASFIGTFVIGVNAARIAYAAFGVYVNIVSAAMKVWGAVTKIAMGIQAAFNAVLNMNPIGLIITAIVAVAAALTIFFTKTETGRKAWANLTAAFKSFISWIGPAWSNLMNGIGEVWSTVWRGVAGFFTTYVVNPIKTAMAAVGGFFSAAWNNVIKPVWDAIVTGIKIAITAIITMALLPFQIAWNVWSAIFGWAYDNLIKPALDAIGNAFSALYAAFIKPALDNIARGWQVLSALASVVWGAISGAISSAWNTITGVVKGATAAVVNWVSVRFEAVKAVATVVWNAISSTISKVWATIKGIVLGAAQAVYDYVNTKFQAVKAGAQIIWNTIKTNISNVWTGIKSVAQLGAQWVYDKVMGPFNKLKTAGIKVFEALRDGIGKAWNGLKAVAAKPVNFIIDTVYTNGIKNLAEKVASKVGLKLTLPTIKGITGFATGGVLPGYTPGRDSVLAHLSPGEGILVPEAVRGLGPGFVGWANKTFSNGRSSGGVGTGGFGLPAFADGGIVGWFKDKAKGVTDFFSDPLGAVANLITTPVKALMGGAGSGLFADLGKGAIDQILGAIPNFFKKQVEKLGGSSSQLVSAAMQAVNAGVPYVWGGSSVPPGLDCSGLVYWAAQQLGLGWPRLTAAGYQAASVAKNMSNVVPGDLLFWGNPAYHVAIAAGAGKMVEEPKPGMSARYTNIWGSPSVGSYVGRNSKVTAPEYLKYDQGGYLQPGLTLAYNATGKPEPVFTHEQAQGAGAGMTDAQMERFAELVGDRVREGADAGVSGRIGSSSRRNVRAVMGV